MNESMILGQTVRSAHPYILYGSVRGLVAECDSLADASRAHRDEYAMFCRIGGGSRSDADIYSITDDGWRPVNPVDAPYQDYTATIITDPGYYGTPDADRAATIRARLREMIERQYPGVTVTESVTVAVTGPDRAGCAEIEEYVRRNWRTVL